MRQNVTIHSLVLLLIIVTANVCSAQPLRKAFILHAYAHPDLNMSERDLLSKIQEEIPHNILKARNLVFEDVSAYADIQQWNPTNYFQDRGQKQVEKMLLARGFRMMFVFSLSYEPQREKRRLLMTGRLYDLDKFHCISQLEAGGESASPRKSKPTDTATIAPTKQPTVKAVDNLCNGVDGLQNIMDVGTVVIDDFEKIQFGLRRLFGILLHVPEIEVDEHSQRIYHKPWDPMVTTFKLNANKSISDFGYWLSPAILNRRLVIGNKSVQFKFLHMPSTMLYGISQMKELSVDSFQVNAELYQIENQNAFGEQLCRNPEGIFDKLTEFGRDRTLRYSSLEATRLADPLVEAIIVPKENNLEGFGRTEIQVPPVHGDYLLRFRFSARDGNTGRSIISYPSYRCFRVRENSFTFELGPYFSGSLTSSAMNETFENQGSSVGMEFGVMKGTPLSLIPWFLPAIHWGGVVTGAFGGIKESVRVPIAGTDTGNISELARHHVDVRFRIRPALLRMPSWIGSLGLAGIAGIGVGAMNIERTLFRWNSTNAESGLPETIVDTGVHASSWHPYFIVEAGGAIAGPNDTKVDIVYEARLLLNEIQPVAEIYPWNTVHKSVSARFTFAIPLLEKRTK